MEGAFTHFANADEPGGGTVGAQLKLFSEALAALAKRGLKPRHIHYANSAGIVLPDSVPGCTLARPGIALYGCKPDPKQAYPLDLRPVVALKSRVVNIKRVAAGTPVSYGGRYVTDRETCIATIPLGYGIGYPRSLADRAHVLIRGGRYRIAGTVTMDYCMVDAGPRPAIEVGDEVTALGSQRATITADDLALLDGTIGYENPLRA